MSRPGPVNSQALIAYSKREKSFADALKLATKLYQKDKRKFTGLKYISHPMTVASLLLEFDFPVSTLVASALQDTQTRTKLKLSTIVNDFGEDVASKVAELTPVWNDDGSINIASYGFVLAKAASDVQSIKLASLLDHLCAIPHNKLVESYPFFDQVAALLPSLSAGNAELRRRVELALRKARAA